MSKAAELNIKGIKCDAPECDYCDMEAEFSESYLNAPCPKCGAPLLTEQDLAAINLMRAMADYWNTMAGPAPDDAERISIPLGLDGSGVITV